MNHNFWINVKVLIVYHLFHLYSTNESRMSSFNFLNLYLNICYLQFECINEEVYTYGK